MCLKAHEFGVEKELEPELELSADEQAVVEKVTKAANKYYIQAAWYLVVSFPHPLAIEIAIASALVRRRTCLRPCPPPC